LQPEDVGIIAEVVASSVKAAMAPVLARLTIVEARQPEKGEKGDRGERGDAGQDGRDGPEGQKGADGVNGKDGRDGIDGKNGSDGLNGNDGLNGKDGTPGLNGKDGKDAEPVTPELILQALSASPDLLQKAVEFHLTAHPPANGKDGADGLAGKDGRDGIDGKEGPEGKRGRDGLPGVPGRDGEKGANGLDGRDGLNGKDGLGFDELAIDFDPIGRPILKFSRGEDVKSFVIGGAYHGIWTEGVTYLRGDSVTWGGSVFIAQSETTAKPETSKDWRLAIKRGRDGKDGKHGRDGKDGKDWNQR
jgi:integrin beta 3